MKCEPMERLVADVPADAVGAVIEKLGSRKGDLFGDDPRGHPDEAGVPGPRPGPLRLPQRVPHRHPGEGIMASVFDSYAPFKGELSRRNTGSLIAFENGESVTYGLWAAQERGALFIGPGIPVYGGMVVGETPKSEDITVNVCRKKQLTNMRASRFRRGPPPGAPRNLSLEQCLEFLADDELLEVTPQDPPPAEADFEPRDPHEGAEGE